MPYNLLKLTKLGSYDSKWGKKCVKKMNLDQALCDWGIAPAWDNSNGEAKESRLRKEIAGLILELGVPPDAKGYFYLREAIIYKVNDPDIVLSMSKVIYPHIAKMFSTSAALVEHAMRHAIKVAWDKGEPASRQRIFSHTLSYSTWSPTNSEFIATIVDHVKLQYNYLAYVTEASGFENGTKRVLPRGNGA